MTALVPSAGQAAAALAAMPALERSEIRKQALGMSGDVLEKLKWITHNSPRDASRIAAAKVILAVAALTSTTNLPRDVVKEKFERTVDVLRAFVPTDQWAALADEIRPIWGDV